MASLFGVDKPKPPSNPIGAALWGLLHQVAAVVGVAPKAGTPSVSEPVLTTGLVTGALRFTNTAGGSLIYTVTGGPTQGAVSVDAAGNYSYMPTLDARLDAAGGTGPTTDSFTVTAFNGLGSTRETVIVPISPDTPTAGAPTVGAPNAVTGVVSGGVSFNDPAGQQLIYTVTKNPAKGTITEFDTTTGKFTYKPTVDAQLAAETAGVVGADTFIVSASNGAVSTPVTVAVVVDPGTPQSGTPVVDTSDTTGVVTGSATFTDPAGGQLVYRVTSAPSRGAITEFNTSTGVFTYAPDPDSDDVADSFVITATNGIHSSTQTISVPTNVVDALVGNWDITSIGGVSDGSEPTGPIPLPDGLHLTFTFTRVDGGFAGINTSTYGDNTASVPWATVSKDGAGTYSGALPADQLAANEQAIREFYSSPTVTVDDVEMSVTFAVTVSGDGQTISATQSTSQQITLTGIGEDGESHTDTIEFSQTVTYNGTKTPDSISV